MDRLPYTIESVSLRASGDVALSGSETVLLDLDPLGATNHNGGSIVFWSRQKALYRCAGENANPANAQNLDNYFGELATHQC